MIRKCLIVCFLLLSFRQLKAQQYGLFNTKTLFDGFENPAQKTFVLDSSRKFASNFFLPYFGINAANKGNDDFIRKLIDEGTYSAKNIPLGTNGINNVYQNSNIYLFTFKIFKSYKYHKEIGLSWQLRTDAQVNYTNETLAILNDPRIFENYPDANFTNAFNNNGYAQSYHQFSITYRENYNKKLAFGAKISLLSGISYNRLNITNSIFKSGSPISPFIAGLKGHYKASFQETDELSKNTLLPTFKNPGLAFSLGTTYTSKKGIFIMANLKDLGLIRWAKSSYVNYFDNIKNPLEISDYTTNPGEIEDKLTDLITEKEGHDSFYSLTNAKADFLISKTFRFYTPSFIVSKNLFYKGGDAALVNRFNYNNFSLSAVPAYNFNGLFLFGLQGMYETPNFEVFLGSDNLFKTIPQVKGAIQQDVAIGSGYNAVSFYMGLGIKFGNTVEHPQNSSTMPGIGDDEPGLFKRIFSIFSKRERE